MKTLRATLAEAAFADAPPASGAGGRLALDPALAQRLLEELIYERVRTQVDLFELTCFEVELDTSIERVMTDLAGMSGDDAPPGAVAGVLVDGAWRRLEAEWRHLRAAASGDDPDGCPICAALDACGAVDVTADVIGHEPLRPRPGKRARRARRSGRA